MVPLLHVEAPDTTTVDEPPNVPELRFSVVLVAPPVLLNVKLPPLMSTAVTAID
jgi:hypothetical protein